MRPEGKPNRLITLYDVYGFFSGASAGYSFFAPEIGSELKLKFELMDSNETDQLEAGSNREAELKIVTLAYLLSDAIEDPKKRQKIAASFAGKILARHPNAKTVRVVIESYELPSMQDYREGKREDWKFFYQATFAKK